MRGCPGCLAGKESACNAGDPISIPGSGRSPGERIGYPPQYSWASLMAQTVKNPPAMLETWVGKIPWRRARQPTLVFLPGESPWTQEPGGLQSMGSQRVGHNWVTKHYSTPQRWNFKKEIVELLFIGKIVFSLMADEESSELIYLTNREMKQNRKWRFCVLELCL